MIVSDVQPPRMYRIGEVIWCRLEEPIQVVEENLVDRIEFWPGVVDDMTLKIQTRPAPAEAKMQVMDIEDEEDEDEDDELEGTGLRSSRRIRKRKAKAKIDWEVKQYYVYRVRLLATTHFCQVTDVGALPYLAYSLPKELTEECFDILKKVMQGADIDLMDVQLKSDYDFDPFEPSSTHGMDERRRRSVVPYTLAVEMAKYITCYWTPTDQFDYTFPIPSLPSGDSPSDGPQASSSSTKQHNSLHIAIQAAMANNAKSTPNAPHVSGANGKSRAELKETASNLLGKDIADQMSSSGPLKTVTQTRYQGLWWGAERIWMDELVRLKLARYQFAPAGAPAVDPPSGPSASTAAAAPEDADLPSEAIGAGERGIFMRIEGLFVAEVQTPEGIIKECRASGMVYELADADWDAPTEKSVVSSGKGKEKATDGIPLDPTLEAPSASRPGTPVKGALATPVSSPNQGPALSAPIRNHFDLPTPPIGFKFQPILPPGNEVVLSLSLISGRYYPGILSHPLLIDTVAKNLRDDKIMPASYLWALQGSVAGIYQSMEPQFWKTDRHTMLVEADGSARNDLASAWNKVKTQRLGLGTPMSPEADVSMEDSFAGPSSQVSVKA